VRWARGVVQASFPRILESGVRFAVGTDSMHGLMAYELETGRGTTGRNQLTPACSPARSLARSA